MKNRILLVALLIATSSAFAQVPSYVPTNGLVGWWPFNGNANDESGNGNNGTVIGATLASDRNGISSSCYDFNYNGMGWNSSLNQVINVPFSSTFNSPQISVSFWYNARSYFFPGIPGTDRVGALVYRYQGGYSNPNGQTWGINLQQNTVNAFVLNASNQNNQTAMVLSCNTNLNQWNNVAFTFDGQSFKLYYNGVLASQQTATIILNSLGNSGLSFGCSNQANGYWYESDASIDDIGYWNRALTQQEITALYNAQICNSTSNTITADGPTTFCAGNSVNLKSDVVGGTYQWRRNGVNITTNATSRTYKATSSGSYTCIATCNGTALTSNAIQVTSKTNASASVTASGATSFCAGDSVTLNCTNLGSNYSVQWYRTNISIENATNYSTVVKQPGTYKVVTRNLTNGCSRISGSAITTSVNCRVAGDITSGTTTEENTTNEARFTANDLSQGVNVFPNPNKGTFTFAYDGEETGDGVLQIINTMGQSIYNSAVTIQEGGYTQEIQLGDNYNKGFYIVRLLINGSYHDSRVMVR